MKEGWKATPLESVVTVVNGGTPKSNVQEYWDGDVNWLTPKDMGRMTTRYIAETPRRITVAGLEKSSARLVPVGSLILSTRAPIGHLAINEAPMAFNQGCRALIPSGAIDATYLYFFLCYNKRALDALGTGTTFKELSASALKSFPVPLPPLEEQKRIVAILDEAFEGLERVRENVATNLENGQSLFSTYLTETINSITADQEEYTVGRMVDEGIIEKPLDGNHGEIHPKKSDFVRQGVPFIMASDLVGGSVDLRHCNFISRKQADALRKGFAKDGDILISHKGTIGRVAILRTDHDYVMLTPQVTYYRIADRMRLEPEFLYFAFQSASFQRQMIGAAEGGATRAYIGITRQRELKVSLPSLAVQRELIAQFISMKSASEICIDGFKRTLANVIDLRQSLLHKAFSGQLT